MCEKRRRSQSSCPQVSHSVLNDLQVSTLAAFLDATAVRYCCPGLLIA
jgi:hypothetical protein